MSHVKNNPAETFARDGFLIVPGLFPAAEMKPIKAEIATVLDAVRSEALARGDDPEKAIHGGVYVGLSARNAVARQLSRDPRILDILEAIYAPNIEFLSDKVVFKSHQTDYGTPWHQDWPYWHGSHKISVWLALDDATVENGCMKLYPGSHRAPVEHDGQVAPGETFGHRLRSDAVDEAKAVTAAVAAGGAVFFLDLTLHSSYPNVSGQDRWAWIGTYRDAQADDLDYSWAVAAAVVRGTGKK
ncbi:MAG TPA: phytanoyl-CoA dioxygenase family protein [Chthonomonadaceae bacterium]|nr:phytanoyl-CoA dioxygenase family protein [Chthonomonadaceae bacterium]